MIKRLAIRNFKSIANLEMDCRRVNIFIGEPNAGKSNILEGLHLFQHNGIFKDYVRVESVSQLFFDFDSSVPFETEADDLKVVGRIDNDELEIDGLLKDEPSFTYQRRLSLDGELNGASTFSGIERLPKIRSYRFKPDIKLGKSNATFLQPPFGHNISEVILSNKDLRLRIQKAILDGLGYKLLFKPDSSDLEIYKEEESGVSISFPYTLVSDTVRKMLFYLAAIDSNKDATVVLEEPESNTFPLYIKYLAERVAQYNPNQFFITTHNPYFLLPVIEKTPENDLTVNLVELDGYQTKVTQLDRTGISKILDLTSDVFLNLDSLKNS